jgi:hypothetical protein
MMATRRVAKISRVFIMLSFFFHSSRYLGLISAAGIFEIMKYSNQGCHSDIQHMALCLKLTPFYTLIIIRFIMMDSNYFSMVEKLTII